MSKMARTVEIPNKVQTELEANDVTCHQCEQQINVLQDTIKCQKEIHLREINEMRQKLDLGDNICLQKERQIKVLKERLELSGCCSICMDTLNTSNHCLVALPCGHLFGDSCVRECSEILNVQNVTIVFQ